MSLSYHKLPVHADHGSSNGVGDGLVWTDCGAPHDILPDVVGPSVSMYRTKTEITASTVSEVLSSSPANRIPSHQLDVHRPCIINKPFEFPDPAQRDVPLDISVVDDSLKTETKQALAEDDDCIIIAEEINDYRIPVQHGSEWSASNIFLFVPSSLKSLQAFSLSKHIRTSSCTKRRRL